MLECVSFVSFRVLDCDHQIKIVADKRGKHYAEEKL